MINNRLDAPLRVFWDVNYFLSHDASTLQKDDVFKVADSIIACRPFYVNLGEDIIHYEHIEELLDKFKKTNIQLSLASASLISEQKLDFLKDHKVNILEFK
ncbi:hypothetical protein ACFL2A_04505, partial [Thermodesulfobacteriota bacterium]